MTGTWNGMGVDKHTKLFEFGNFFFLFQNGHLGIVPLPLGHWTQSPISSPFLLLSRLSLQKTSEKIEGRRR